jgi:phage tail-like protein
MTSSAAASETVKPPFTAFNFGIELSVPDVADRVCSGAFAECDGLEQTVDVKTIREGGNNGVQIRLAGATSYGTLTLKRGMTSAFDLWKWLDAISASPWTRGSCTVVMLAPDHSERAHFVLGRVLPVKLKAPPLNAKDGMVAVEELQLAYEWLSLREATRA